MAEKAKKKLPKRSSSAYRKLYRASLWAKQQRRKEARRQEQARRHKINVERGYTAWELSRER